MKTKKKNKQNIKNKIYKIIMWLEDSLLILAGIFMFAGSHLLYTVDTWNPETFVYRWDVLVAITSASIAVLIIILYDVKWRICR